MESPDSVTKTYFENWKEGLYYSNPVRIGGKNMVYEPEKEVQIRMLAKSKLYADLKTVPMKLKSQNSIDTAIIHVHGGGFIGGTSASH